MTSQAPRAAKEDWSDEQKLVDSIRSAVAREVEERAQQIAAAQDERQSDVYVSGDNRLNENKCPLFRKRYVNVNINASMQTFSLQSSRSARHRVSFLDHSQHLQGSCVGKAAAIHQGAR